VIGTPFYVMERRRGVVIDDSFPEEIEPTPELCRGLSETVCDTLVQLHEVDWKVAGLNGIGRPEGFLERQVEGWIARYDKAKTEEIEEVGPLTAWLSASVPESPPPTIVHNDYKLNNLILDSADPTTPVALLDWEMTTLGDPLFDLAVSLSYYVEASDPEDLKGVIRTVTSTPGFMPREEFMERYAQKSGRDLTRMHWYMVFGYFKLAAIVQQIYSRWKKGQTKDERFSNFDERVRIIILHAYNLSHSGDA
jgi:aminoglycoside phosphotransferase (APT) family kinase protein